MPVCVLPHPPEPLTKLESVRFLSKIFHSQGMIILMR
jgi:hypothetical protein